MTTPIAGQSGGGAVPLAPMPGGRPPDGYTVAASLAGCGSSRGRRCPYGRFRCWRSRRSCGLHFSGAGCGTGWCLPPIWRPPSQWWSWRPSQGPTTWVAPSPVSGHTGYGGGGRARFVAFRPMPEVAGGASASELALTMARARMHRRQQARQLAQDNPVLARELAIGRPDVPHDYDDGGLVDVNHVPGDVLASSLGLTPAESAAVAATGISLAGSAAPKSCPPTRNWLPTGWRQFVTGCCSAELARQELRGRTNSISRSEDGQLKGRRATLCVRRASGGGAGDGRAW